MASDLLAEMNALHVAPDDLTYQGLLSAASSAADLPKAERIWSAAKSHGFTPNVASMISCAAKAKDLQTAEPLGRLWSVRCHREPSFLAEIT